MKVSAEKAYPFVAQVRNTIYTDLQAAFAAAQDGDTVKLLDNVTLTLDSADDFMVVYNRNYILATNKNITLDLAGKKITLNATYTGALVQGAICVYENGELQFEENIR